MVCRPLRPSLPIAAFPKQAPSLCDDHIPWEHTLTVKVPTEHPQAATNKGIRSTHTRTHIRLTLLRFYFTPCLTIYLTERVRRACGRHQAYNARKLHRVARVRLTNPV